MVFLFIRMPTGNLSHVKTSIPESLVHFCPHFKSCKRYTWTYNRMNIGSICSIDTMHSTECSRYNTPHCPPPSGMYSRYSTMHNIVKQYRNTVGGRHTQTQSTDIRHYGIFPL